MKKKKMSPFRKQLEEFRQKVAKSNWPMLKMSKAQIIAQLRKTREEIWQEDIKFGLRSRQ